MGSWRKENADDLEDSIFANNPFLEDLSRVEGFA